MNTSDGVAVEVLLVEGRRDSQVRGTLGKDHRDELLAAYAGSGMSHARFARREGLTYSTFAGGCRSGGKSLMRRHRSRIVLLRLRRGWRRKKRSTMKRAAPVRVEFRGDSGSGRGLRCGHSEGRMVAGRLTRRNRGVLQGCRDCRRTYPGAEGGPLISGW